MLTSTIKGDNQSVVGFAFEVVCKSKAEKGKYD
jgi:hypothetical protein